MYPLVEIHESGVVETFNKVRVAAVNIVGRLAINSRATYKFLQLANGNWIGDNNVLWHEPRLATDRRRIAVIVPHLEVVDGGIEVAFQRCFVTITVVHGPVQVISHPRNFVCQFWMPCYALGFFVPLEMERIGFPL